MNARTAQKRLAHAKKVWEEKQLAAASAMKDFEVAFSIISDNKSELSDSDWEEIEKAAEERKAQIKDFLLNARMVYLEKVSQFGGNLTDVN